MFLSRQSRGKLKIVASKPDFSLDLAALESAMGPKTKIVLINTPNNPTGKIYPENDLLALAETMKRKGARYGRSLYLVSDEPYRKLAYDGAKVASPLASCPNSIVVSSYSKSILAGERSLRRGESLPGSGRIAAAQPPTASSDLSTRPA
jgi:aspartate aminotransferase